MKKWIFLSIAALVLASCDKPKQGCPGSDEKTFNITGFARIKAGETFNVIVTKGNTFSVKATGCANDLADLEPGVISGDFLEIKYRNNRSDRYPVDIAITLPVLGQINLSGAAKGTVNGFANDQHVITTVLSGTATCTVNGAAINAAIDLSGTSVLNISGLTESLYGMVTGAARLNAYDLTGIEVDVSTTGTAKAYVKPDIRFYADASDASTIYYKGNPGETHFVTSGNGKIVKE